MERSRWQILTLAVLTLSLTTGCNRQDKECLTRICLKTAQRVEAGLSEFRKNFNEGWLAGAILEARVAGRLRWDKSLENTAIIVGNNGEMIELSGSVKTVEQKQRAYDLANTTLGVKEVANLLQIAP